ncbi:hypothetical protein 162309619 [Organic Lake phycodnavirus]|nr:hypothetical protein 162309619 [Organic Lake phycodnavirus]
MNALGEVHSPPCLIKEIYDLLMPLLKDDVHIDVYEPGIGPGYFMNYILTKKKQHIPDATYNIVTHPPLSKGIFSTKH